jgi:hypothetical protein
MADQDQILEAKSKLIARYFDADPASDSQEYPPPPLRKNFIGIAAGLKITDGEIQDLPCLTVFVRAKLSKDYLGKYALDKEMYGVPTDVIEVGGFRAMGARRWAGPATTLTSGSDVSMATGAIHGTLCAFVEDNLGAAHLLSCGHVLDSRGGLFKHVVSQGQVVADVVGATRLFQGFGFGASRFIQQDGVIAKLKSGVEPDLRLPGGGYLGDETPLHAHKWMKVRKVGKSVADGRVVHTHARVEIDYPNQTSILDDQIIVWDHSRKFAQPGDSGSLVIAEHHDELRAVGMLIGAGDPTSFLKKRIKFRPSYSVVSPLAPILEQLHVTLLIK